MEGGIPAAFRTGELSMRKYLFAWLLGVPVSLLVVVYFFTHLF